MDKPTPLINSSILPQYRGQVVRIIGRCQKLLLQTSDMGNVQVTLNALSGTGYVEVIGKVSESSDTETVREFTTVSFGETLDINLVEQVIQISHQLPQLFKETL